MLDTLTLPTIPIAPTIPILPSVQLIDWQQRAVEEIVDKLYGNTNYQGVVLRGSTGLGKMYIAALAIRRMVDEGKLVLPAGSITPFPVLWLCPKSVKIQTNRVLKECGIFHLCLVMSYGELKAKLGTDLFLEYVTTIENGQPVIKPVWKHSFLPAIVKCDEIQKLKNRGAMITSVMCACPSSVKWLGASATPWQRVSDARCSLIRTAATPKPYYYFPANYKNVEAITHSIASPKHPDEYSPSSVERLRESLEPWIVELKGVRFKYPSSTKCKVIQFKTSEQRTQYENAYLEYLEELRKANKNTEHGSMAILVAMQKFRQKAEFLRYAQLAERGYEAVTQSGKQVIFGVNFIDTARGIWTHLVKVLGVPKERISFIVGGQTEKARQLAVDNFQQGKSDYIVVTTTSGGVGISLHHDRASTKPRHVVIPLPWSAIDLVQFLGRGHRLTSLSPTTQDMLLFADTIETQKVMPVLERKVKCISKSVTAKEQFSTLFERSAGDDIDREESDKIAEIVETDAHKGDTDNGIDDSEEGITGEGLENQE